MGERAAIRGGSCKDWLARAAFVFLGCLLTPSFICAQVEPPGPASPPPSSGDSFKIHRGHPIRTETELTLVGASVTDPLGRIVTGLEQQDFRVFEDGTEQEIVSFMSEDVPVSIGVIFDMSGSMADKIDKSRQAAVQFFRTANPKDEFFLVDFNDRAQLVSPDILCQSR